MSNITTVPLVTEYSEYPGEREAFMASLHQFHNARGTPMRRLPFLGGKEFDFFRTYKMVRANGGMLKVQENRQFKAIANTFDFPPTCTNGGHQMRAHYVKFLYPYERVKEYNLPDDLTIDETELPAKDEVGQAGGGGGGGGGASGGDRTGGKLVNFSLAALSGLLGDREEEAPSGAVAPRDRAINPFQILPLTSGKSAGSLLKSLGGTPLGSKRARYGLDYGPSTAGARKMLRLVRALESGIAAEVEWGLDTIAGISRDDPEVILATPGAVEQLAQLCEACVAVAAPANDMAARLAAVAFSGGESMTPEDVSMLRELAVSLPAPRLQDRGGELAASLFADKSLQELDASGRLDALLLIVRNLTFAETGDAVLLDFEGIYASLLMVLLGDSLPRFVDAAEVFVKLSRRLNLDSDPKARVLFTVFTSCLKHPYHVVRRVALAGLANLSINETNERVLLACEGHIVPLALHSLNHLSHEVRLAALDLVFNLSYFSLSLPDHVTGSPDLLVSLVRHLTAKSEDRSTPDLTAQRVAALTLANLMTNRPTKFRAALAPHAQLITQVMLTGPTAVTSVLVGLVGVMEGDD